ncbi:MAG: prolyl oligopeptidase family serine peptidase [Candidatus Heimdallarchaeota archaeon]|nr:prolyl oligopeptidase family serine peptidase [Candidatus Heimdallarchaeota archaeon]
MRHYSTFPRLITGTSYSGFSSWCGIIIYPDIFDVSIPVCCMTDLVVDYETTRPDLRPYSEAMMGGSPEEVPERFYNGSPINFINNIKGLILIVQGANDPNVSPANVDAVETAMRAAQLEYETLIFDDEGHGILRKNNKRTKYIEIENFVKTMFED